MYMEYCGGGDLAHYIKKLKEENKYADEGFVWHIFAQLIAALYRCHCGEDPPAIGDNVFGSVKQEKQGLPSKVGGKVMILHRDLKPDNSKFRNTLYVDVS